jgi:RNA polymerase sigma-70 factor (ECF subfamily)
VDRVELDAGTPVAAAIDSETPVWLSELSLPEGERDAAVARLHAYLLRVARFELRRRSATLAHLRSGELDDLAMQSADDALMAILRKLHTFRAESRFTTWAAKFAILEASVKARKRAWQKRETLLAPATWAQLPASGAADDGHESAELLGAVGAAIRTLTPHQQEVLVAVTLQDVPIDVLAERLGMTRGAVYKTLHDARRRLRRRLAEMEER